MKTQRTERAMVAVVKGQVYDPINKKNDEVFFYVYLLASGGMGKEPHVVRTEIISTPISSEEVQAFTKACAVRWGSTLPMMGPKQFMNKIWPMSPVFHEMSFLANND